MARGNETSIWGYVRIFFVTIILLILFIFFLFWRIDNPRVEAIRLQVTDALPDFSGIFAPVANIGNLTIRFRSYEQLVQDNQDLRLKLRELDQWREAALQLEQTNAELRALNNLKFTPKQSFISGEVSADLGGNFSQAALVNVGRDKGVKVGAPVMDSLGLVGRVVAVGAESSRVLLLSDTQSQIAATIMPDRIRAIVKGNGSSILDITIADPGKRILAGSRVLTSGDGYLPPELFIGQIRVSSDGSLSLPLAANLTALEFVRIPLDRPAPQIDTNPPLVLRNGQIDGEQGSGSSESQQNE